jgi:hypothetical protein
MKARLKMQNENQIKAEASRLLFMAKKAKDEVNRKCLLYARWALLATLNERRELTEYTQLSEIGGEEIISGSGAIEGQIEHYDMWRSGKYPGISVSPSDRRAVRWDGWTR